MIETIHYHQFGVEGCRLTEPMEFKKLALISGLNQSGKSLLLKSVWFMTFSLNMYKILGTLQIPNIDEVFKEQLDIMFDLTFSSKEKLSGAIMIQDPNRSTVEYMINVKEGVIDHFNINVMDPEKFKVHEINQVNYNTKEARTFNQYESYRKLKKRFGVTLSDMKSAQELGEFFRLYDMIWFEGIEFQMRRYETHPEEVQEKIERWAEVFNKAETGTLPRMESVFFRSGSMFFATETDPEASVVDMSAGTQSLIMLTFFGH